MTEETTERPLTGNGSENHSSSLRPESDLKKKKIFFFLILLITVVLILGTSVPMLTKNMVESQLKVFSEGVSEYARSMTGMDVNFTYDTLDIEGVGYSKIAKINNPTLVLSRRTLMGIETIKLSADAMRVVPDNSGAGKLLIEFPDVFEMWRGNRHYTLNFNANVKYVLNRSISGQSENQTHAVILPGKTIKIREKKGEKVIATSTVRYDENPTLLIQFSPTENSANARAQFGHLKLINEKGKSLLSIEKFESNSDKSNKDGKQFFNSKTHLKKIVLTAQKNKSGPYNLDLILDGERQLAETSGFVYNNSDIKLKSLKLSGKKFDIEAKGKITRRPDDSLPFGSGKVQIKNLPGIIADQSIKPEIRSATRAFAAMVSKSEDGTIPKNLSFAIDREKLGQVTIADSSFWDVAQIVIASMFLASDEPTVLPEATPNAKAEKAAAKAATAAAKESKVKAKENMPTPKIIKVPAQAPAVPKPE